MKKTIMHSVLAGARTRTRDLLRARREPPTARHGGCFAKQAFPCDFQAIAQHHVQGVWEIISCKILYDSVALWLIIIKL